MINYNNKPGKEIKVIGELEKNYKPNISIITPFYNGGKTLMETVNSVLSQTYPFFEWIIVDDGSKDEASIKELKKVAQMDQRIKVFYKENGGPSQARDFGIEKSSESSKYIYFLDCDDLIENTMLEVLYWSLETHPDASFAYTTMVNFGDSEFIWEKYLTVELEKKENLICISSMIKKTDLLEVGCFGIKEKSMYEDWNLWLKLLAKGKKPIRISAPIFWYRTSNTGELSRAKQNHEKAMEYINNTASTITKDVEIIQFPREGELYPKTSKLNFTVPSYKKSNKYKLLFIFPWTVLGGADLFTLELLKRIDKTKFDVIVITTLPSENDLRNEFTQYCSEYYDLSSFLERKDFLNFVDYIVNSRKVDQIMISNSKYGYYMAPYLKNKYKNLSIIDYIHSIDPIDPKGAFGRCSRDVDEFLDATYSCNNFTKNQLEKDFDKKDVKTIYIGTNEKRFDPKKFNSKELKVKYNIPQNKKVISFIARLSEEKRPQLFVNIAEEILKERDDIIFLIVGDGYLYKEIEKKVSDNIIMLGAVRESEEIYAISDLTVNCSSLEGLALTSYESLSMNVPVVSTDVGGQSELIDDTVGKLVHYDKNRNKKEELADYIKAILEVIDNLDNYSKNCRKKILKDFTFDKMVQNMSEEFIKYINSPKKKVSNENNTIYELALETLHTDYYYTTKNYIETKFNINYDSQNVSSNNSFKTKLKQKGYNFCSKYNIVNEVKVFLYLYRTIYQLTIGLILRISWFAFELLRLIIDLIKYIILSIPSIFKIIYKFLKK